MYRYIWKIKLDNPDREDEFIQHWKDGSTILQQFPGALGTHMHKVRGEEHSFFAVAEWESKDARDAMQKEIETSSTDRARQWQKMPNNEDFGEIINFAGEETGVVLPE
jgi:heme-degrading monooxygenase HmoA